MTCGLRDTCDVAVDWGHRTLTTARDACLRASSALSDEGRNPEDCRNDDEESVERYDSKNDGHPCSNHLERFRDIVGDEE